MVINFDALAMMIKKRNNRGIDLYIYLEIKSVFEIRVALNINICPNKSYMSIPFIGVLTLIRKDLLLRLINSVDYPVETFAIMFQGGFSDFDFGCIKNPMIKKFSFISSSINIGVSRGWNYLIRNYNAPYWIISGDDNYFEAGTLEKIAKHMTEKESSLENVFCGINIKEKTGNIIPAGFSTYIVTQKIMENVGLFDENIYPAYFEDNDLWHRIILANEKTETIPETYIYTGDDKDTGSCTLHSVHPVYRRKMDYCYSRNEKYFHDKWNIKGRNFSNPFNQHLLSIKDPVTHENYFVNQEILLGHRNPPVFFVMED